MIPWALNLSAAVSAAGVRESKSNTPTSETPTAIPTPILISVLESSPEEADWFVGGPAAGVGGSAVTLISDTVTGFEGGAVVDKNIQRVSRVSCNLIAIGGVIFAQARSGTWQWSLIVESCGIVTLVLD